MAPNTIILFVKEMCEAIMAEYQSEVITTPKKYHSIVLLPIMNLFASIWVQMVLDSQIWNTSNLKATYSTRLQVSQGPALYQVMINCTHISL